MTSHSLSAWPARLRWPIALVLIASLPQPAAAAPPGAEVLAGWPNDGVGAPADRVLFPTILDLAARRDGSVVILTPTGLLAYTPGGAVTRLAGGPRAWTRAFASQHTRQAGYGSHKLALLLDAQDRPILAHSSTGAFGYDTLLRFDSANEVMHLWAPRPGVALEAAVSTTDGRTWVLAVPPSPARPAWWLVEANGKARKIREPGHDELTAVRGEPEMSLVARRARFRGVAYRDRLVVPARGGTVLVDPASGAIAPGHALAHPATFLDAHGVGFDLAPFAGERRALSFAAPGARRATVTCRDLPLMDVEHAALASDGSPLLAGFYNRGGMYACVVRVAQDGRWRFDTGGARMTLAQPRRTPLAPRHIALLGPDDVVVHDDLRGQLLRIRPGRVVEALTAPWPSGPGLAAGQPARAGAVHPQAIAADQAGRLYVGDGHRVLRFRPGGLVEEVFVAPRDQWMRQLVVAPDGTLYYGVSPQAGQRPQPVRRVVGPRQSVALPAATTHALALAIDRQGSLCMVLPAAEEGGAEQLASWTAVRGFELVGRVKRGFYGGGSNDLHDHQQLAIDPLGRWWLTDGAPTFVTPPASVGDAFAQLRESTPYAALSRFEPASRRHALCVGDGQEVLGGRDVDDGLGSAYSFAFNAAGDLYVCDDFAVRRASMRGVQSTGGRYSLVIPSKCSWSPSASALVGCSTSRRCSGGP